MDNKILNNYKQDIIDTVIKVVNIDSVRTDPKPNMPFGEGVAKCLDYVLNLGKEMGFETYNCDNYAGHIDFGQGEQVFGILGHLDVVPVTDGWTTPPFEATIRNGNIYGRGTSDDKGPMIASLFALKILKDNGFKPTKKVRLIFGCDEETNMDCIKYYRTKVKLPDIAISPDGDFPVINIEKGIYAMDLDIGQLPLEVLDIQAGTRVNVVPDKCVAKLALTVDEEKIKATGVSYVKGEDCFTLTTNGVSCHGAMPYLGKNATWQMFDALASIFDGNKQLKFVSEKMCRDVYGVTWGFGLEDKESGKITTNIGVVSLENNHLKIKLDVRYPVTFTNEFVAEQMTKNSIDTFKIEQHHIKKPMCVPSDSYLVQTLLKIYNDTMGVKAEPIAIGGGTYSRVLPMCVAFGPAFPMEQTAIHEKDELINIDNLMKMTQMYMHAIEEICK